MLTFYRWYGSSGNRNKICDPIIKHIHSALQDSWAGTYHQKTIKTSYRERFKTWLYKQEEYRLGWMIFSITGHSCVFTMITAAMVLATGNHFIFWPILIGNMMLVMIVCLAGLPSRVIIPVLFLSVIVDIAIILTCLLNGFDFGATYR